MKTLFVLSALFTTSLAIAQETVRPHFMSVTCVSDRTPLDGPRVELRIESGETGYDVTLLRQGPRSHQAETVIVGTGLECVFGSANAIVSTCRGPAQGTEGQFVNVEIQSMESTMATSRGDFVERYFEAKLLSPEFDSRMTLRFADGTCAARASRIAR